MAGEKILLVDDEFDIVKTTAKHIPIIIITALTQKADEESWRNSGIDFYLKKPFDFNELSNKIRELLDRGGKR